MAAAPQTDTVRITINEVEIDVPKGELIVESVKRLGLEIPIFCYHPRMKAVGMCRMCLVEVGFKQPDGSVRKMPKPQAGCTLPAADGMVVYTDTEAVHRDRRGVLEFLLINHPLDCPICDRGGECPLQNNTLAYGPSTSRFVEMKRHLPKAYPLSQYVTLDLERCIQCGRCVRFTEEISGDSQLAFRFRGAEMQPSTFQLLDFESKFSGNVIEICPVGALTNARYRFRARPWDLETKPAVCTECSNGCNVWFDYRAGRFVRINGRTNEAVNEEWTCDRGKFGHEWYNAADRLQAPNARREGDFARVSWANAYEELLARFQADGSRVALLAGPRVSNEGAYAAQDLFRRVFRSNHIDARWGRTLLPALERLPASTGTIAGLESKSGILVFGTSLADELPIVHLRVRKAAVLRGAKVVVATSTPTEVDAFATVVLRFNEGSEASVAAGLAQLLSGGTGPDTPEHIAQVAGVSAEALRAAADCLRENAALVASEAAADRGTGLDALRTVAGTSLEFNVWPTGTNARGEAELGLRPDVLPGGAPISDSSARTAFEAAAGYSMPDAPGADTRGILTAAAEGRLDALWLVGCDPLRDFPDRALAERALENVPYLVVMDTNPTEAAEFASLVLPMTAPAEQDGTWTNCEGRVQRIAPVVQAPGEAKPAWRIFSEVALRAHPTTPAFNAGEVMDVVARTVPAFAGCTFPHLVGEGVVIGVGTSPDTPAAEATAPA